MESDPDGVGPDSGFAGVCANALKVETVRAIGNWKYSLTCAVY